MQTWIQWQRSVWSGITVVESQTLTHLRYLCYTTYVILLPIQIPKEDQNLCGGSLASQNSTLMTWLLSRNVCLKLNRTVLQNYGVSLSKQHIVVICHGTKTMNSGRVGDWQSGKLLWLHMHELSFTSQSWAESLELSLCKALKLSEGCWKSRNTE